MPASVENLLMRVNLKQESFTENRRLLALSWATLLISSHSRFCVDLLNNFFLAYYAIFSILRGDRRVLLKCMTQDGWECCECRGI